MKAVVYDRYGAPDVLRVTDVPEPGPPRGGDVLVRVTRAALNPKDALTRKGRFRALSGGRFPKRVGMDLAGVVEASDAKAFAKGDRVFGFVAEVRYLRGTVAELVMCRPYELAHTLSDVSDEDAASLALVGLTSLQAYRDVARVRSGDRVLVNGASGGVGTAAIQIGKTLGCEVHTVSSAANVGLCESLGASRAWTYPENAWRREPPFDVIFDVFGNLAFADVRAHLTRTGRYVSTVPSPRRFVRDVVSRLAKQEERLVVVRPRTHDLETIGRWLASGELRAVIEGRFPMDRVREAFERIESKRTRGKIVVEVAPASGPSTSSRAT